MRDSNPRSKLVYPALLSLEKRKNCLVVKSYLMPTLKYQTFSTALRESFKGGGIYPHLKSADPSQLTEKRVSSEYGLQKQPIFGRETSQLPVASLNVGCFLDLQ